MLEPGRHVLSATGLVKRFGKKEAVAGVDFSMANGEVVGLLGPNGAGKTTIFYMVAGFVRPTLGSIQLDGQDIGGLPMYRRAQRGIAYLPQEASVFRKMTVEENLLAILETRSDMSPKERVHRAETLLEEFGLSSLRRQRAYTLSGGERRRTEIARALAISPQFLLLDEPFAGIDPIALGDIKRLISQLSAQGIGILITDHNVRETLEITRRAYIIYQGKILVSGTSTQLFTDPIARRVYLGNLTGPGPSDQATRPVPWRLRRLEARKDRQRRRLGLEVRWRKSAHRQD